MASLKADGTEVEPVVAKEDVTVQDPSSSDPAHGRRIVAGEQVPPDLVEAYEAVSGGSRKARTAPEKHKAQLEPQDTK